MVAGPKQVHTRWARWAVGLAEIAGAAIAVAVAIFGLANVVAGPTAVEDNWVAILVGATVVTGFVAAALAFIMAILATVTHDRWTRLRVPLSVFPALVTLLVLGEAFWWE